MPPIDNTNKTPKDLEIDALFVKLAEDVSKIETSENTTYEYKTKETKTSASGDVIPLFSYTVTSNQKDLAQDSFIENLKLKGLWP